MAMRPFLAALNKWIGGVGRTRRRGAPLRKRVRPAVEAMEDRLTPAGVFVVASFFDSALYEFDASSGALKGTLNAPYSTSTALSGIAGVTIGPDGNLYVSSQNNDEVFKYDFASNQLSTFITTAQMAPFVVANGTATFAPAGLRFGPDGNLYVAQNGGFGSTNGAVVRFDITNSGGTLSYSGTGVTVANTGDGIVQPTGLAFGTAAGDTDSLYVSTNGGTGNVIKIADADGTPSASSFLSGTFTLNFASGLVFGPDGSDADANPDLYVVDLGATSFEGQVLHFNSNGSFNSEFNQPQGSDPGSLEFQFPSDALFTPAGKLLTANLGPAHPPNLQGSVFEFNADGTFSRALVTSSEFPNTGPGTSGISPSQLAFFQPPTVTLPGGAAGYTENAAPVVLDSGATVTDPDSPDFNGGTLTVSFSANGTADDRLGIANQGTGPGQVSVSGSTVSVGGTAIGTFTGGTGTTPLVVTLNANATPAAVQAVVRALTFSNVSDAPSTAPRTVQVVVTDGDGGTSNAATKTVNVTAVNDPPTSSGGPFTTNEDTPLSATLSGSDPDGDPLTFTVLSQPANGTVVITNAAIGAFTYTPNPDYNGPDSFRFIVDDGQVASNITTVHITVNSVIDPPAVTGTGARPRVADTGTQTPFATATVKNVEDPSQTLTVTVTYNAANGVFTPASLAASGFTREAGGRYGFTGDAAQATAALRQLVFNPTDNQVAPGQSVTTAFTVTVNNGSMTGTDQGASVTALSVNDPPHGVARTYSVARNGVLNVAAAQGVLRGATDPDRGTVLSAVLVQRPSVGTLVFRANGSFTYTPPQNFHGRVFFRFRVRDNKGGLSPVLTDFIMLC